LQNKDGITALLAASINGHQDTVLFIVQHGGNIEDTDGKGKNIAHYAVAKESRDVLKFLSENHANLLHSQNFDGEIPLFQALREGRTWITQYVREEPKENRTAMYDDLRKLIQRLKEQNVPSGKAGSYIVEAARLGLLCLLQRTVDMGGDINVRADNGESPLHAACKSGQEATVQYLCEHGAQLELQDNNGNTALHVAVSNGHLDVTTVLVEKGANLCAVDESGSTALHIAVKGGYLNIVQYFADSFAPIDMRNAKKETALFVAAAEGHEKIVSFLIEQGAGIGVRDIERKTALDIATDKGYTAITQLLKDRAEGRIVVCSNLDKSRTLAVPYT
jgi:ankyrin repeat protein